MLRPFLFQFTDNYTGWSAGKFVAGVCGLSKKLQTEKNVLELSVMTCMSGCSFILNLTTREQLKLKQFLIGQYTGQTDGINYGKIALPLSGLYWSNIYETSCPMYLQIVCFQELNLGVSVVPVIR